MESFDKDKKLQQLFEQFKKMDKFHKAFIAEFSLAVFDIIKQSYPDTPKDQEILELLEIYARQTLSAAEDLIDKNNTYPDYRMKEEVEIMGRLVKRVSKEDKNPDFSEVIHKKAKEMIVNHFPSIKNLSPEGFRILERYTKMHNLEFVGNLYRDDIMLKQK